MKEQNSNTQSAVGLSISSEIAGNPCKGNEENKNIAKLERDNAIKIERAWR